MNRGASMKPLEELEFDFGAWGWDPSELFFPKFVERDDRIFNRQVGERWDPSRYDSVGGVALSELHENHTHFLEAHNHRWARTPYACWRINLAIARAARVCWLDTLSRQFPGVEFVAPVINELVVWQDDNDVPSKIDQVMPTLYLWTRRGDPQDELLNSLSLSDCGDLIEGPNNTRVPAEQVFTRAGQFRVSFLRSLQRAAK